MVKLRRSGKQEKEAFALLGPLGCSVATAGLAMVGLVAMAANEKRKAVGLLLNDNGAFGHGSLVEMAAALARAAASV